MPWVLKSAWLELEVSWTPGGSPAPRSLQVSLVSWWSHYAQARGILPYPKAHQCSAWVLSVQISGVLHLSWNSPHYLPQDQSPKLPRITMTNPTLNLLGSGWLPLPGAGAGKRQKAAMTLQFTWSCSFSQGQSPALPIVEYPRRADCYILISLSVIHARRTSLVAVTSGISKLGPSGQM